MVLAHDAAADDDYVLAQPGIGAFYAVYAAGERLGKAGLLIREGIRYLEQAGGIHYDVIAQAARTDKQAFPSRLFLSSLTQICASGTAIIALTAVIQHTHGDAAAHCPFFRVGAFAKSGDLPRYLVATGAGKRHFYLSAKDTLLQRAQRYRVDLYESLAISEIRRG
jgi:hypothetical protein